MIDGIRAQYHSKEGYKMRQEIIHGKKFDGQEYMAQREKVAWYLFFGVVATGAIALITLL